MEEDHTNEDVLEVNEDDIEEIIYGDDQGDNEGLNEGVEDLDFEDTDPQEESMQDDAALVFAEHQGSVFSVHVNPVDPTMVVSGGEDDLAYVWNTRDAAAAEKKLEGHKDSVITSQFSHDGKYIGTADMSGIIFIWKTGTMVQVCKLECSDIEWSLWHPLAHVFLAGASDGDVYMWKVPSGELKVISGNGSKAAAGCVLPQGKRLYVGYEDGSLKLWDLKSASTIIQIGGDLGHTDAVTSVACSKSGILLASGSEGGVIKVHNANSGKQIASFDLKRQNESDKESEDTFGVECVGFSADQQLLLSGNLKGEFQIWDLSTQRLRHNCSHPFGVTRMTFSDCYPSLVFTGCFDGHVRVWNLKSGSLEHDFQGHQDNILDFSISGDGSLLVAGSDDGTARVFSLSCLSSARQ